jgi:NAD(P)-dependent dehydrogenase (short-subunit alcohol dehydrogenase family)
MLTAYGAKVVGTGRNEEELTALKNEGGIYDFVVADITKEGECERVVSGAVSILGGLTTIVNAAGGLRVGAVGAIYYYNMKLNTQAPFEIMAHAIPHLKEQKDKSPSIVTVSSVNGKQSFAACASYCMSKAAVDQLTRCASIDLAEFGIRVNSVNPGVIKTNLHKVRFAFCWP